MVFSNAASKTGIVEDIDFLVGTNSTSYPIEDKTRNINRCYDEVVSLLLQSDGRWVWDDSNNTDLPIATTALVDSQQDYSITGASYLNINRVEVKDVNGNYYLLIPINEKEIPQALTEFQKTPGRPIYYTKVGDSVFLYPKPSSANVTLSAGLKIYYQRPPSYFATTDTTKSPGFAPLFHRILSYSGAIDYCLSNSLNTKLATLEAKMTKMMSDLITFYANREKDYQVSLGLRRENYGTDDPQYGSSGGYYRDKVAF